MKKILCFTLMIISFSSFADIVLEGGGSTIIRRQDVGSRVFCIRDNTPPPLEVCYIKADGNFKIVDEYGDILISHSRIEHALHSLANFIKSGSCSKNTFQRCRVRQIGSSFGVFVGPTMAISHSQRAHADHTANQIRNAGGCL